MTIFRIQIAIVLMALAAIFYNKWYLEGYGVSPDNNNCNSLLKYGRYIHDVNPMPTEWQPDGCSLKQYSHHDLNLCFQPGDEIIFYGDSTARQAYLGFANTIFRESMQTRGSHFDMSVELNGITIKFLWDKYFNDTGLATIKDIARNGYSSQEKTTAAAYSRDANYKPKTYLYVAGGAWFAYTEDPSQVAELYRQNMQSLFETIDARVDGAFDAVYFGAPLIPYYRLLSLGRNTKLTLDQYSRMIRFSDDFFGFKRTNDTVKSKTSPTLQHGGTRPRTLKDRTNEVSAFYFPVVNELGAENHEGLYDDIVVHYTQPSSLIQGNILLNHMCNQRIADATKKPLAGASCCVKYQNKGRLRLAKAVKISLLVSLLIFAAAFNFKSSALLVKSTFFVLAVMGLVSLWSHVSNETGFISKTSISFSSTELKGLLQCWVVASVFSTYFSSPNNLDKEKLFESSPLSQSFLGEWQGICVSLLLIIEFTGSRYLVNTFDYEIAARVLVSMWSMVEVYKICQDFLLHAQNNTSSMKQVYLSILPRLAQSLACILTLPLFLSIGVEEAFNSNPLPGSLPPFYAALATKLTFWTIVIFIVVPYCSGQDKHALKTFGLVAVSLGARMFVSASSSSVQADFWAILVVVWISLVLLHKEPRSPFSLSFSSATSAASSLSSSILSELTLEDDSGDLFPSFPVAAGTALFFLLFVNLVQYVFSYFIFVNNNGLNNPMPYIELHKEEFDRYLAARGHNYTFFAHSVIVLVTAASYVVLRLAVLKYTRATTGKSSGYYASCWVALGQISYEALELYPYVFLAASGTLRLHYLPTGVVNSSSVTRTLYLVDSAFKFPYAQWRLVEKIRKCFSIALSGGVLWTLARTCAFVWEPLAVLQQGTWAITRSTSDFSKDESC